ncbi:exported protein of unknown function (plasmid) [Azospirillum baldaniorum]|uniref:Uncharacterized protein n=1 Tax=Azospirillum baldaniorum TaxID=1064539 RepID=A0A9P1NRN7_9PROT|nr:exported protein of unknown function [Azospirillum baldaniorum]
MISITAWKTPKTLGSLSPASPGRLAGAHPARLTAQWIRTIVTANHDAAESGAQKERNQEKTSVDHNGPTRCRFGFVALGPPLSCQSGHRARPGGASG